ncbi:adenylate kinase [Bacteroidales bacterium OttesenSCG-928-M06]|nr:adenylate kinase [Bacteroidales bacterium OttesenSCG-928-M06]
MLNIVIFGAPGSGKGTQSELIIQKYGLHHISTGEILRKEIENKSALGLIAEEYIGQGKLVPDQLVIDMFADIIDKTAHNKGYIFDGFPRTLSQSKALDDMLRERNTSVAAVFSLSVEEEELINRLLKRGEACGRSDDNLETIKNRLTVYKEQTEPLKEYYKKKGKLFNVKGSGSIEDIFERITEVIDRLSY